MPDTVVAERLTTYGAELSGSPLYDVKGGILVDGGFLLLAETKVLRFDAGGNVSLVSGGESGSGPGEFRRPASIVRVEGALAAVWDNGLKRVTVLPEDGGLPVVQRVLEPSGFSEEIRFVGVVNRSGSFSTIMRTDVRPMGDFATGLRREAIRVLLFNPDSTPRSWEVQEIEGPPEFWWKIGTSLGSAEPILGAGQAYASNSQILLVADGPTGQVTSIDLESGETRVVAKLIDPRGAFSEAEIETVRRARADDPYPGLAQVIKDRLGREFFADGIEAIQRAPAQLSPAPFDRVVVDETHAWLRAQPRPGDSKQLWRRVSIETGAIDITVTLPRDSEVMDISGHRALALERNEFGEESVSVFTWN